jgi:hypothetical protein
MRAPDPAIGRVACPACGAPIGTACTARVDGVDTDWTHDMRYNADLLAQLSGARETKCDERVEASK